MAEQTFLRNGRWLTKEQLKQIKKVKPVSKQAKDKK